MSRHAAALDRLRALGLRVRRELGPLASLAAGRAEATSPVELGERWLTDDVPGPAGDAFAAALSDIVEAQVRNFPTNLFWDFDYPAARLFELTRGAGDAVHARLASASALVVALEGAFGLESTIRFRYAHDFVYGFDWARWVRRDADARAGVGPLDAPFLSYMRRRAGEIAVLIAQNDAKYPSLPSGAARNPFGFRRGATEEAKLLRDLAERSLLPVEAWRADAVPRCDLPFSELREERAKALGLWEGRV